VIDDGLMITLEDRDGSDILKCRRRSPHSLTIGHGV